MEVKQGDYVAWTALDEYGRPKRWTTTHIVGYDTTKTLCGRTIPKRTEAELGDEYDGVIHCSKCSAVWRNKRHAYCPPFRG